MSAVRVPWSGAAFLVYLGGITIVSAAGALLEVEAHSHGASGFVGWALLIFAVVATLALLARGTGHRVTAGLLALSTVVAFVTLLGALLDWFGWLADPTDSPFDGFRVSLLFLELTVVVAAAVALALFRFPLLVLVLAAGAWFFVTDLLSGGGDWSAVVTLLSGLGLLGAALAVDRGATRTYAFWLHVAAGVAIGGAVLWFFHDGDWDWIVVAIVGVLYLALGEGLRRSSWIVLGAWGMLQTTAHFANKWSDVAGAFFTLFYLFPFVASTAFEEVGERPTDPWAAPVVFAIAGAVFVLLGLLVARRRRAAVPGAELL